MIYAISHSSFSVLCEIKEKTVLSLRNLNDEVRLFHLIQQNISCCCELEI